jgi:DNA-binding transcriptional LysR family regulator
MKTLPDLNYLKYFYFVAKLGGFTRAANFLNVQQPVVSRAIKLLEDEFSCKLLERQRKSIILTEDGKQVFQRCEPLFNSAQSISEYFEQTHDKVSEITLACSDSLSTGLIERVLHKLNRDFPKLILIHHSGSANTFINDIQSGKLDMGLFFNVPKLPPDLVKSKILDADFYYLIKSSLKKDSSVLDNFIATTSQKYESPQQLPLYKKYRQANKNAVVSFASNSSTARLMSVKNGLGVTILPKFMVKNELEKGSLATLLQPEKMGLYLIERNSSYRSNVKNSLISIVKEIVMG